MSTDPVSPERQPRSKWSSCLIAALTLLVVGVLLVFWVRWEAQQREMEVKGRWEHQVADLESGKTTTMISPEPRFLEEFVKDRPEAASMVTTVDFCMGKVSDERFGYLRQLPHLQEIIFYDISEGADSFLSKITGMESITKLSFSKTRLSEEGVHAVASFPNLNRLDTCYAWRRPMQLAFSPKNAPTRPTSRWPA